MKKSVIPDPIEQAESRGFGIRAFAPKLVSCCPRSLLDFIRRTPFISSAARKLLNIFSIETDETTPVKMKEGPLKDYILELKLRGQTDFWRGEHEPAVCAVLEKITQHKAIQQQPVAYDIGSHIGYFSMVLARFLGESGRVFSFDPNPINDRQIKRHIEINHCSNIIPHQIAISNKSGLANFGGWYSMGTGQILDENNLWASEDSLHLARLSPDKVRALYESELTLCDFDFRLAERKKENIQTPLSLLENAQNLAFNEKWTEAFYEIQRTRESLRDICYKGQEPIQVQTIALDDFVYKQNNPKPLLLKLDVEGAEDKVLEGATQILSDAKPFILCELHNIYAGQNVLKILADHNYIVFDIQEDSPNVGSDDLFSYLSKIDDPIIPIRPGGVHIIAFMRY